MWVRFFFFTDTPTTEIYTLSLHDALPISAGAGGMVTDGASDGRARSMAVRRACGSAAGPVPGAGTWPRSEEHTSELQSRRDLVCRLLLEKKNIIVSPSHHVALHALAARVA